MLDSTENKSFLRESSENLFYLVKASPVRSLFYLCAVPFGILWIFRGSLLTAFALQAYLVTAGVFVDGPFKDQKEGVKKRWHWKAMIGGGALVHPPLLAGMWYLDRMNSSFVTGGATLILLVFVASVLETIILESIVNRFRPEQPSNKQAG